MAHDSLQVQVRNEWIPSGSRNKLHMWPIQFSRVNIQQHDSTYGRVVEIAMKLNQFTAT